MKGKLVLLALSCSVLSVGCGGAAKPGAAPEAQTASTAEPDAAGSEPSSVTEGGERCVSYCDKVSECGTLDGSRVSSCPSDCQESHGRAQAAGCLQQFNAVFECVDACNAEDFSAQCEELMRAYDECLLNSS
jgi:hypothetical protein